MECTIARLGDTYRDQLEETHGLERSDDIARIAALGVKRLRFPVLWEAIERGTRNWQWHDAQLDEVRRCGMEPIIGLVHHGSGPPHTHLLDRKFPKLLAAYAGEVARRYPWARLFTPINEPLTTARFSCLYGHWYPHRRDSGAFLQALITETRATIAAMRAIRAVIPDAKLIQTEDLGKTFASRRLAYQAAYENQRRWLSLDLLFGRVDPDHAFYRDFLACGVSSAILDEIRQAGCAPDIIGINHYLTSERFLDHRVTLYPERFRGSNGRHLYADIEAVRLDLPPAEVGPPARLREAWERYHAPLAITEIHHGCSRDEQIRWLAEVWQSAKDVRRQGVDLRAVTLWSLFGAMDWNSLLTRRDGYYEPGAFDVRGPTARPTALACAAQALNQDQYGHPVLDMPGWWHRGERRYQQRRRMRHRRQIAELPRRILITGATGTLGQAFARICRARGLPFLLLSRQDMDVADPRAVGGKLDLLRPWAVINAAGYVQVARAELEAERCMRENALGAEILASACARRGIPYVIFSSDLVFDGSLGRPYVETDSAAPTTVYGASKAEAERRVSLVHPAPLIARTSAFFGPWDRANFVFHMVSALQNHRCFHASDSVIVSPTYVPDLVHATLDLLIDGEAGIWHLANQGAISWYGLAQRVADALALDQRHLVRSEGEPVTTALASERGQILPSLDDAITRWMNDSPLLQQLDQTSRAA
jgi:dTDP-4-dehydrorhamnose reductase